ncbi:MAG: NHL repeat-containing protein [Bdellovibrionales bacterium]|nr:NHL repeat-containing protein [Bdellovibrionales bacterium]
MQRILVPLLFVLSACSNGTFQSSYTSIVLTPKFALGQPDFDTTTGGSGAAGLQHPYGVFVQGTQLFVSDAGNHRVLVWDSLPTTFAQPADRVIGQSSFTGTSANQGGSTNQNTLYNPSGLWATASHLYVSDTGNNRLLYYALPVAATNANATAVLGQTTFTANGSGTSGLEMDNPRSVAVGGGNLYVSELSNNRVLVFGSETPSTGTGAAHVLGNAAFASGVYGTSSTRFSNLRGLFFLGSRLFLADTDNCRIVMWSTLPNYDNDIAVDAVLGQPDFVTGTSNSGNVAANNFFNPVHVSTNGTYTFVSDSTDSRVLVFDGIPSGEQDAKYVVGQSSFSAHGTGTSGFRLNGPQGVNATSTELYVADFGNHRVLVYDLP